MNRIKLYRIAKGMKWIELIKKTGIPSQALWEMQNGWRKPNEQQAIKLAAAFGLKSTDVARFLHDNLEISDEKIMKL